MRWYERLYVGEKAKKHRYETIQAVRNGQAFGFYVLTPAAGDRNLLDIYPALTLKLPYYQKQDLLIVGIAEDFEDASMLAGRIYIVNSRFRQVIFHSLAIPNRDAYKECHTCG